MNYLLSKHTTDEKSDSYLAGMMERRHSANPSEGFMQFKTLRERLFWARRQFAQLTQVELRDRMQENSGVIIGANYISQLESDDVKNRPSFEVVAAMAKELKVSMDWLAGFVENHEPVRSEDLIVHYFSPEADEIARIVDSMHPSQRDLVLNLVKSMISAPTQRQRERAEIRDMLDSIERRLGRDVRREVEQVMRNKGMPVDPAS